MVAGVKQYGLVLYCICSTELSVLKYAALQYFTCGFLQLADTALGSGRLLGTCFFTFIAITNSFLNCKLSSSCTISS